MVQAGVEGLTQQDRAEQQQIDQCGRVLAFSKQVLFTVSFYF